MASVDIFLIAYLEMKNPAIITVQEGFNWGRILMYHLYPIKFKPDFYTGSFYQIGPNYLSFLKKNTLLNKTILFDINENNYDAAIQMGFNHMVMDKNSESPHYNSNWHK